LSELKQSLRLEKIANAAAAALLDAKHPLGRGAPFTFALGIFYDGQCEGVLTFGNPISNNAVKRYGLRQCEALELRKLWISDRPPKNSESRILAVAARIIRGRYPQIRLLLTYCDGEEKASAYKASGWIPQEAYRYVREIKVDGHWLSMRDALRKRLTTKATEEKTECRRKYVLPLTAEMAQKVSPAKSEAAAGSGSRATIGTSTAKSPSAPLTGTGSIVRTLARTQAKSPASPPQQAAASSPARNCRQSTTSTTARATPVGSSR
jgi:hypothetical protein